mgnify:CR=1 FL=1
MVPAIGFRLAREPSGIPCTGARGEDARPGDAEAVPRDRVRLPGPTDAYRHDEPPNQYDQYRVVLMPAQPPSGMPSIENRV